MWGCRQDLRNSSPQRLHCTWHMSAGSSLYMTSGFTTSRIGCWRSVTGPVEVARLTAAAPSVCSQYSPAVRL